MFNKFFSNSNKKKQKAIFSFIIDIDNNLNINTQLLVPHKSLDITENIAQTMYAINSGLLLPNMIDMLNKQYEKDTSHKQFIKDIIYYLNELYDIEYSKKPLIKPTETFVSKINETNANK